MKNARILLAASGALALSGCISFGPKPPKVLVTLTPVTTVTAETTHTAGPGQTITILYPSAPAAISVPRVAVYGATSLSYVKDVAFNDTPAHLFQHLLSETTAAKTGKVVLDVRQYTLDPGTRVSGALVQFGIDPGAMQAVVSYDGVISRSGSTGVETRRFEARVPVSAIDAQSVGPALNQAANNVAAEVAGWIGG